MSRLQRTYNFSRSALWHGLPGTHTHMYLHTFHDVGSVTGLHIVLTTFKVELLDFKCMHESSVWLASILCVQHVHVSIRSGSMSSDTSAVLLQLLCSVQSIFVVF